MEILIKAVDSTHPDPTKDARGCYKRGDVVEVGPDGYYGLYTETARAPIDGGKFCRVRISDKTVAQAEAFIQARLGADAFFSMPDSTTHSDPTTITLRRRISINPDWLPTNVKKQLNQTGLYVTTWAQVRAYIRDKRDGLGM